jgi:hypothetical protein
VMQRYGWEDGEKMQMEWGIKTITTLSNYWNRHEASDLLDMVTRFAELSHLFRIPRTEDGSSWMVWDKGRVCKDTTMRKWKLWTRPIILLSQIMSLMRLALLLNKGIPWTLLLKAVIPNKILDDISDLDMDTVLLTEKWKWEILS